MTHPTAPLTEAELTACEECGAPVGSYHRDGCQDLWWPHNKVHVVKKTDPSIDSEIETIVDMIGGQISRDEFSVDAVTADLHDRLKAFVTHIAALSRPQVAGMNDALTVMKQAAAWFQKYADEHRAKGDDEKAARNQKRADYLRNSIAGVARPEVAEWNRAIEAASAWHDQRAKDTPDAFEMEFHKASATAIRAMLAAAPSQIAGYEPPQAGEMARIFVDDMLAENDIVLLAPVVRRMVAKVSGILGNDAGSQRIRGALALAATLAAGGK